MMFACLHVTQKLLLHVWSFSPMWRDEGCEVGAFGSVFCSAGGFRTKWNLLLDKSRGLLCICHLSDAALPLVQLLCSPPAMSGLLFSPSASEKHFAVIINHSVFVTSHHLVEDPLDIVAEVKSEIFTGRFCPKIVIRWDEEALTFLQFQSCITNLIFIRVLAYSNSSSGSNEE